MEVFLNLCWLLVVLPAFLTWRRQRPFSFRRAHGDMLSLAALVCALVLLFPIISASDDLHAFRQEAEESSSRLKAGGANGAHSVASTHVPAAIPVRTLFVPPEKGATATAPVRATVGILLRPRATLQERAPPPHVDL